VSRARGGVVMIPANGILYSDLKVSAGDVLNHQGVDSEAYARFEMQARVWLGRVWKILADLFSLNLNTRGLSFSSRGARLQFEVAIVMILIIPALTLCYLVVSHSLEITMMGNVSKGLVMGLIPFFLLGVWLLVQYPLAVMKLRHHLRQLAEGALPDQIDLPRDSDDLKAIQKYLAMIVENARQRIKTIRDQQEALIAAEQQRVMVQSFGTICHHFGQPVTVVHVGTQLLEQEPLSPHGREVLGTCRDASVTMNELLQTLQGLSTCRTESYLDRNAAGEPVSDNLRILDITANA